MKTSTLRKNPNLKRQRGVGFIEVLISMVIISVGFLNIAALQTSAKKSNFDAIQRTTATILARDIVEKMRANPISLNAYINAGLGGGTRTQPGVLCTAAAKCNSLQLAAFDLWSFEDTLDGASESRDIGGVTSETGGMSDPTACISGPIAGGAGVYTITIVWRGLNELTNVSTNTCGVGSGLYGAAEEFRRILTFDTFIAP